MKFAALEKMFLAIFFVLVVVAVCFATVFSGVRVGTGIGTFSGANIGMFVLLGDFVVAGLVAVFGSLRKRDEEEEKLFK